MTVPPVPGSGLIVIETKFVFGGFEAIFDGPAAAFYCNQLLRRRAFRTPSGEEGEFTVPDVAADQQASRPGSSQRAVVVSSLEVGQIRGRPNHTAAALWCRRLLTVVAMPCQEGSAQRCQRCRQRPAPCPKSGPDGWTQCPGRSPCRPCAAWLRCRPFHTRYPLQRKRTAPWLRSPARSSSVPAAASSRSICPWEGAPPSSGRERPSTPSASKVGDR